MLQIWNHVAVLLQVPEPSSHRAIRCLPHIMGCSTSKIKLMMESLGELSVRNKKMGKVIAKSPQLLLQKPEEFFQVAGELFLLLGRCLLFFHPWM